MPTSNGLLNGLGFVAPGYNKPDQDNSIKFAPTYIQYSILKGEGLSVWMIDRYDVVNKKGNPPWLKREIA